jgi:hypothetical protein
MKPIIKILKSNTKTVMIVENATLIVSIPKNGMISKYFYCLSCWSSVCICIKFYRVIKKEHLEKYHMAKKVIDCQSNSLAVEAFIHQNSMV